MANLRQVNTGLQSDLSAQTRQIEEFSVEMDSLIELEGRIRDLTGLPPRRSAADDTRQGGQGGGEYYANQSMAVSPTGSLPDEPEHAVWTLSALAEEARYRQETFGEVIDFITGERELLAATPCIWPVDSPDAWISSGFGYREDPINGKRLFHDGLDVVAPVKSPVMATADGMVTFAGWDGGLGWVVTINHGHGYKTRYGHNHKLLVEKGDRVSRGDVIALEGSTGRTTGPHVHYAVIRDGKKVNPYRYLVK
jgi:murein DD-endopeptidase MepM/ murein hydrolase activator NlpD